MYVHFTGQESAPLFFCLSVGLLMLKLEADIIVDHITLFVTCHCYSYQSCTYLDCTPFCEEIKRIPLNNSRVGPLLVVLV